MNNQTFKLKAQVDHVDKQAMVHSYYSLLCQELKASFKDETGKRDQIERKR